MLMECESDWWLTYPYKYIYMKVSWDHENFHIYIYMETIVKIIHMFQSTNQMRPANLD